MDFIIGGAYQGKRDCAVKRYGLTEDDIYTCTESEGIRFGARCIDRLEEFTLWCVKNGTDPLEVFRENREAWRGCVLICQDIIHHHEAKRSFIRVQAAVAVHIACLELVYGVGQRPFAYLFLVSCSLSLAPKFQHVERVVHLPEREEGAVCLFFCCSRKHKKQTEQQK